MPNFLTPYLVYIKIGAILLGAAGLFGGGMYLEARLKDSTIADMKLADANAKVEAEVEERVLTQRADKVTHDTDVAAAHAQQKIVTVTNTITRKVPQYVTKETDAAFPLPCGFVRLHDAAASGVDPDTVPIPAGLNDGSTCPVAASDAAGVIAWNYGQALQWKAQLDTWDAWYDGQVKAWGQPKESADAAH